MSSTLAWAKHLRPGHDTNGCPYCPIAVPDTLPVLTLNTPVVAGSWLKGVVQVRAEDKNGWSYQIEDRWFRAHMVEAFDPKEPDASAS